jgi:hypothetical protein
MAIARSRVRVGLRTVRNSLLAVLLVAGCAERSRPAPAGATIDGLRLVTTFTLDDGTIESASLADDARVVVVARPNILAVFDSTGTPQATLGWTGSGPGEFRMLSWAEPGGRDSVWAYDFQLRRLSLFAAGAFADSWRIDGASTPNVVARLRSGEALLVDPFFPMPSRTGGLAVDTVGVLALRLPATTARPLRRIPWETRFQDVRSVASIGQPLGPRASLVASDSGFFVAFGNRADVAEYDASGALRRRLELALPERAVSDLEAEWARRQAERPTRIEGVATLFASVPLPTTAPVIAGLLVDHDQLWVKTFQVSDSVPTMWYAFRASGAPRDSLSLPAHAQLLAIRAPLVLLKTTAPSGEEFLVLYAREP